MDISVRSTLLKEMLYFCAIFLLKDELFTYYRTVGCLQRFHDPGLVRPSETGRIQLVQQIAPAWRNRDQLVDRLL